MSTQSNTLPESFGSQKIASATPSLMQTIYWSIRRELWEYRSIYLAPLAAAGIAFIGFLIQLSRNIHLAVGADFPHHEAFTTPYGLSTALIMGVAFLVSIFYSLDALYSERRDRTILFWKSLPVSDVTTVLSKISIPLLILPFLAFGIVVVTILVMLPLNAIALSGSGLSFAQLWNSLELWPSAKMLLYHLVTIHILWYAPLYAWLLLVSAWARRTPLLWAFLPPLIVSLFEKLAFHTSYISNVLLGRIGMGAGAGGPGEATGTGAPLMPSPRFMPDRFFFLPGLWIGLLVTAGFLALAVYLRHRREPI
jgi:ABC-2 type transport system permease protein